MRLSAVAAVAVALGLAALALWHTPTPRSRVPRHIKIVVASGRPLVGFFDGLKADPRVLDRLRALPKARTCGTPAKPGLVGRAARFLGLGGTVHAQDYCPGNGCVAC
jgi:hypothetical protein